MKVSNVGLTDLLKELSFTVKWERTIPEFDAKWMPWRSPNGPVKSLFAS